MAECQQAVNWSVLDHGNSVWSYTQRLLNGDFEGFRVPNWLTENYDEIRANVYGDSIIKEYNIFHDCGKPYCLMVDEDGKRHFPNHAEVSKQTYKSLPVGYIPHAITISNLIGWDMILHTATAEEILALNLTKQDLYTLLITALAEIHSNASMFGGIENVSFKQKWKKLDRRGNMILKGGAA